MKKNKKKKNISRSIKIAFKTFFLGLVLIVTLLRLAQYMMQKDEPKKVANEEGIAKPTGAVEKQSGNLQQFGDWYYSPSIPTDGLEVSFAFTQAENDKPNGGISIKCIGLSRALFAIYLPGKDVGNGEDRKVKYWIDDIGPVTERWSLEGDKIVNYDQEQSKALAFKMMEGDRLKIGAYDLSYNAHTHSFSLRGAYAALTRVMEKCGG